MEKLIRTVAYIFALIVSIGIYLMMVQAIGDHWDKSYFWASIFSFALLPIAIIYAPYAAVTTWGWSWFKAVGLFILGPILSTILTVGAFALASRFGKEPTTTTSNSNKYTKYTNIACIILVLGGASYFMRTLGGKTNETYFKSFISKSTAKKVAQTVAENSISRWGATPPDEMLATLKSDLESCINARVTIWLESNDPILNEKATDSSKQTILEPIIKSCIAEGEKKFTK